MQNKCLFCQKDICKGYPFYKKHNNILFIFNILSKNLYFLKNYDNFRNNTMMKIEELEDDIPELNRFKKIFDEGLLLV